MCEGVESIGTFAFEGCESLMEIRIPTSVTDIWQCAFVGCKTLEEVNIPDGVRNVWHEAFVGCHGLKKVTVGRDVKFIAHKAFYACISLTDVYYRGRSCPDACDDIYWNTPTNLVSHVRSLPVGVGLKRLFGGEMTWHGRKIVRDVGNE